MRVIRTRPPTTVPDPHSAITLVLRGLGLERGPAQDFTQRTEHRPGGGAHQRVNLVSDYAHQLVAERADLIEERVAALGHPFAVNVLAADRSPGAPRCFLHNGGYARRRDAFTPPATPTYVRYRAQNVQVVKDSPSSYTAVHIGNPVYYGDPLYVMDHILDHTRFGFGEVETVAHAHRVYARDGADAPGWYVVQGVNASGPHPNRHEALEQLALVVSDRFRGRS